MSFNMQSRNDLSAAARYPGQFAEMALRGASQILDMQMTSVRTLLQTQARAAAVFGFPDCSGVFENGSGEQLRQVLSKSTEQLVNTTHRASEAAAELGRQVGQVVQAQASTAAQAWQDGLEQLGAQTDESLKQITATAQQQAEQFERSARSMAEGARQGLREGGERLREQTQEASQRTRETLAQAGDQQRQGIEAVSSGKPPHIGGDEKQKRERGAA
jgi:ElaB/YqjD/DUF883 family membrane-anchored ribosome-binding protein